MSLTKVYGLHALKCGWIAAEEGKLRRIPPVYSEPEWGFMYFPRLTHVHNIIRAIAGAARSRRRPDEPSHFEL